MVNRTANAHLRHGVGKGDKVNLHLTNWPEFLFFWFTTTKIDTVMMPTNLLSTPEELSYPVHHSESVLSVTQPNLLPTVHAIRGRCPNLRQIALPGVRAGSRRGRTQLAIHRGAAARAGGNHARPAGRDGYRTHRGVIVADMEIGPSARFSANATPGTGRAP